MKTPDGKEITDALLCQRFPRLFADRYASMKTTCMCWGFAVGPGWMGIIYDAAVQLEPLVNQWIAENPYPNEFPFWVFSLANCRVVWQWRCYSLLALWDWLLIRIGLRQPNPWWPRASQVKEKYGTLRFYMANETLAMDIIISRAESQSARTCEICGEPGKLRSKAWYYTRCADCWGEQNK